ncbi:MAG: 2-C-methyl-D-erythritol 4-phosphate cytidylyltransferase [Firmicutes bacterium]|nr:2-C-methyl-D-erythritol 4-phosphate cytidylyltransferase [Bacillota bacterium]
MGQVIAIVPAAGKGVRMGLKGPGKQFVHLAGKPVLAHTLLALEASAQIDGIIVVIGQDQVKLGWHVVNSYSVGKVQAVIPGGRTRQESVWAGLQHVPDDTEIVLVHDGARPLAKTELIDAAIQAARTYGAVGVAVPVKDTIKVRDVAGFVASTPPRDSLWAIQTPQAFHYSILHEAHTRANESGCVGTDDCMLVEKLGKPVQLIEGSYRNIKLTTPEDLIVASALLASDEPEDDGQERQSPTVTRVGWGYDIHRLVEGRPLILGGVEIPYHQGLLGHSDADVLLHAVMDSLLGAMALGDIGQHFPDTDMRWRGANSLHLLQQVNKILIRSSGTLPKISHIDCVIIAERPRLAPYLLQMRLNIAEALGLTVDQVSIKATTAEGLGPAGQGEGIIAQAIAAILA